MSNVQRPGQRAAPARPAPRTARSTGRSSPAAQGDGRLRSRSRPRGAHSSGPKYPDSSVLWCGIMGPEGVPMRQHVSRPTAAVGATVVAVLLLAGAATPRTRSAKSVGKSSPATPSSASAAADTSLGKGTWLLGLSSAGGADAEKATTTYVSYDPSTGVAHARKMPGVNTPSADPDDAALLVSADRTWAIPDTSIPRDEGRSGRLTVYSVDLRRLEGDRHPPAHRRRLDHAARLGLRPALPRGAARRRLPQPGVAARRRWRGARARPAPSPADPGSSPTASTTTPVSRTSRASPATRRCPRATGSADKTAVARDGGTVLASGSAVLTKLPTEPLPARRGVHRRPGHDLGLLRRQLLDQDLLPAEGRPAVEGLRQAERRRRADRGRLPAGAASAALTGWPTSIPSCSDRPTAAPRRPRPAPHGTGEAGPVRRGRRPRPRGRRRPAHRDRRLRAAALGAEAARQADPEGPGRGEGRAAGAHQDPGRRRQDGRGDAGRGRAGLARRHVRDPEPGRRGVAGGRRGRLRGARARRRAPPVRLRAARPRRARPAARARSTSTGAPRCRGRGSTTSPAPAPTWSSPWSTWRWTRPARTGSPRCPAGAGQAARDGGHRLPRPGRRRRLPHRGRGHCTSSAPRRCRWRRTTATRSSTPRRCRAATPRSAPATARRQARTARTPAGSSGCTGSTRWRCSRTRRSRSRRRAPTAARAGRRSSSTSSSSPTA